jgi:hypothetical protein
MSRLGVFALFVALCCLVGTQRVYAYDTSGLHAFFNDDKTE